MQTDTQTHNIEFKLLDRTSNYRKASMIEEPCIIHVVKSGWRRDGKTSEYFVFEEDGFGIEPWRSSVQLMTEEEIRRKYPNITI